MPIWTAADAEGEQDHVELGFIQHADDHIGVWCDLFDLGGYSLGFPMLAVLVFLGRHMNLRVIWFRWAGPSI